jgi:hypothetical protein
MGLVLPPFSKTNTEASSDVRDTRTLAARSVEALTNHMVTSIIKEVTRGNNGDKTPLEKDKAQTDEEIR